MNMSGRFISYLQNKQKGIWQALRIAAADGLVVIDEKNDAVTATNRLLLTFPDLHAALQRLTDEWAERHVNVGALFHHLVNKKNQGEEDHDEFL